MTVLLRFPSLRGECAARRAVQDVYRWFRAGETVEVEVGVGSIATLRRAIGEAGLPPILLVPIDDGPELEPRTERAIRVALLGHGTVGGGVREALLSHGFEVTGVAVRDPLRHRHVTEPLTSDAPKLVEGPADIVVELMGGADPATACMRRAHALGRKVVTANKAVVARCPDIAAVVRFSASVGGAVPVVETARRWSGRVRTVEGVLNGTCNFVLGRLAAGETFDAAVLAAQVAGFAETDPSYDLDGWDAACKAVVLAREAFGVELDVDSVEREPLRGSPGRGVWRQVTEVSSRGASVRLRPIEEGPFRALVGEENAAILTLVDGARIALRGKGAGRWPTATSVMADVLDAAGELREERARVAS
jgi:homoserine dehydrogenase